MSKQIAVIGLGKFGTNLCIQLAKEGAQVLAIDVDEKPVRKLSEVVAQAIIADTSDEDVAKELKLDKFDDVVVSIGSDIKASILVSIILKEAGVKKIWVKTKDSLHMKVLEKIGVDFIINPERDMAIRISEQLLFDHLIDFVHLKDDISIYELAVPEKCVTETIKSLEIDPDLHILAIKREKQLITAVTEDTMLEVRDVLILAGDKLKLQESIARVA